MPPEEPVLIVAGPTAVGKSALALDIAEAVGAHVLSADSRQIYRGLDIGTAKPSAEDRARVPHHLIDHLEPGDPYSAGQFLRDARSVLSRLRAERVPVVVVGGSTLYVHALIEGLADVPRVPRSVTAHLSTVATTREGREALYAELLALDPEAAATLDPTKTQRLVRFVGVLRTSGRPPSTFWAESYGPPVPHRLVVLSRPRPDLYDAIDRRVVRMIEAGLVEEAEGLYRRGDPVRHLLRTTIGYRELIPVFESERALPEAVRLIQRNTRRYAKRQLTWYRRYEDAVRFDAEAASARVVLERLAWPSST